MTEQCNSVWAAALGGQQALPPTVSSQPPWLHGMLGLWSVIEKPTMFQILVPMTAFSQPLASLNRPGYDLLCFP